MSVWEPTEAQIEKAAREGYSDGYLVPFDALPEWAQDVHRDRARAVLLAVGPDIAAKAWDEAYQAGAFDTLRSPREATENPYREEARRG